MKKVITTGKTVELATELALNKLGVSRDRVIVTVLTQPSRGLFGWIGKRDAEVEVEVLPVNPIDEARKFLAAVLTEMHLADVIVTVEELSEHSYQFRLQGEAIGVLIGRRGATLDSLQYLVNLVANKHSEKFLRIVLDAEDYRNRRKETLERLADRLAKKATQTRREVVLEPMGATERKVIHSYLQERSDIVTFSQGEEPYRKVVIAPRGGGRPGAGSGHKPRHAEKNHSPRHSHKKGGPRRQGSSGKSSTSTSVASKEQTPKV